MQSATPLSKTGLATVIRGLAQSEKRFDLRYCPCRLYYRKDTAGPETGGQE